MFSLIITLIAVALVVALALATVYFGGTVSRDGAAQAQAAALVNHGQQLLSAADLFSVSNGRWPASMAELVSGGYLSTVPTLTSAQAAWTQPVAGQPTFVLASGVSAATCRAVNRKTRGDDGILTRAYPGYATQCYGASLSGLKVVVTKAPLDAVLGAAEVGAGALPDASDTASWLVVPGYRLSSDGSGGSGSGSTPSQPTQNTMTLNVYATPLAGEAWEPRYRIALTHISGAPLSELNPYSATDPGADDILVVNFGGYTNYVSHGDTVNLAQLDLAYGYWSQDLSQAAPAGTEMAFNMSQQYGVLATLNSVVLVSNGNNTQAWCVTLNRDTYYPNRWEAAAPVLPGACK